MGQLGVLCWEPNEMDTLLAAGWEKEDVFVEKGGHLGMFLTPPCDCKVKLEELRAAARAWRAAWQIEEYPAEKAARRAMFAILDEEPEPVPQPTVLEAGKGLLKAMETINLAFDGGDEEAVIGAVVALEDAIARKDADDE